VFETDAWFCFRGCGFLYFGGGFWLGGRGGTRWAEGLWWHDGRIRRKFNSMVYGDRQVLTNGLMNCARLGGVVDVGGADVIDRAESK
jgi:hypothetical protein